PIGSSLEEEPISSSEEESAPPRSLLRHSPTPYGTGVGGLLPRSRARPPRRRPRSRIPLHPNAEEPAPRTLLSGSTRESALGSPGWSQWKKRREKKKKEKRRRKSLRRSWSWRRKGLP